ncbi:MAG: hypothetical protein IT437_07500 [Phycisphaerales bacterium]|nr:hypothetical protein [Phycisphaerales bacterium]
MSGRAAILGIAVAGLAAAALLWSGRSAAAARWRIDQGRTRLASIREQSAEVARLRASAPRDQDRPAAPENLPHTVSSVLRACGLPASSLASFGTSGESRDMDIATRRASLVLQRVALPQVGRFLAEWRRAEPRWTVTGIDIAPHGDPPAAGGDLPLQASITLESSIRVPGARP